MLIRELYRLASCYQAARNDRTNPPPNLGDPATAPLVVLVHNTMFGNMPARDAAVLPPGCAFTTDRRYAGKAAAVVFHIPTLWRLPFRKRPGQLWAGWSMESEVNYPQLADPAFLRRLDLTLTTRLHSDVPDLYIPTLEAAAWYRPPAAKSTANLAVAIVSSNIHRSGRLALLTALMRHLDVHSYGRVLNNRPFPTPDTGAPSKLQLLANYKFTLALENSICRDYVTEKFFDPLLAGSVPVYLGAPNVEAFAPGDHCYIDAAKFPSPRHLAEYLEHLNTDDEAYAAYFAWKRKPLRPDFLRLQELAARPVGARLCQLLQSRASRDRSQ